MEEKNFLYDKFIKHFFICLCTVSALCLGIMLYYACTKVVVVSAEEAKAQVDATVEGDKEELTELVINAVAYEIEPVSSDDSGELVISCPAGISGEDVAFSVRPDLKTITFMFSEINPEFFKSAPPTGDYGKISTVSVDGNDSATALVIGYKGEGYPRLHYSTLGITLSFEENAGKKVVVIDPFYGGKYSGTIVGSLTEKDVNLKLAQKIERLAESKDYSVFLTRTADVTLLTGERLDVIAALNADYYIGLTLSANLDDLKEFGMSGVYNELYYRNGFENVDFANAVLRDAAVAASNRALGLYKATEDDIILMALEVPAVCFRAGTISNSKEAELLASGDYLDKIAEGIINSLDKTVR